MLKKYVGKIYWKRMVENILEKDTKKYIKQKY